MEHSIVPTKEEVGETIILVLRDSRTTITREELRKKVKAAESTQQSRKRQLDEDKSDDDDDDDEGACDKCGKKTGYLARCTQCEKWYHPRCAPVCVTVQEAKNAVKKDNAFYCSEE